MPINSIESRKLLCFSINFNDQNLKTLKVLLQKMMVRVKACDAEDFAVKFYLTLL